MKSIFTLLVLSSVCLASPPLAKEAHRLTIQAEIKAREEEKTRFTNSVEYVIGQSIKDGKYYCYVVLPDDLYMFKDCLIDLKNKGYTFKYRAEDRLLYILWGEVNLPKDVVNIELKDILLIKKIIVPRIFNPRVLPGW